MTFSQMSIATRSNRTWLNNAKRLLGKKLHRTPSGARWWGMVWTLNQEIGISLKSAARIADLLSSHVPSPTRVRIPGSADGAIALRIDLERFQSTANAALSAAYAFGKPRARGRPRRPQRRRPLVDVFPATWEIRVDDEPLKLDRLARQLRDWNAYPRGIESGLAFIMDSATMRAVRHLALVTTKGDIDVLVERPPDANRARAS
jgi:hypothetical protein